MSIIPLSGFAFFRDSGRKSLAYIQFVAGVNSSLPYRHPRPNSTRSSLTSSVDFQYMLPSVVENAPLSLGKRPLLPKPPPTQYLSFSSISTIVSIVVIRIGAKIRLLWSIAVFSNKCHLLRFESFPTEVSKSKKFGTLNFVLMTDVNRFSQMFRSIFPLAFRSTCWERESRVHFITKSSSQTTHRPHESEERF